MSYFASPAEHAANAPETWVVVKRGAGSWALETAGGAGLDRYATRTAAEAERLPGGFHVRRYAAEGRWYAGEAPVGQRSWADCLADRERMAARRAARALERVSV